MSIKELSTRIGKTGTATITIGKGAICLPVIINDARNVFGRVEYQVEPTAGTGSVWIAAGNVRTDAEAQKEVA